MLDDFRRLLTDEDLSKHGPLVEQVPKWSFDRSAYSQLGMFLVAIAAAGVLLAISFAVVVSNKPDEQLPFQQAMWGFAGVAGVLALYGLGTGLWRLMFGIAHVGQWWLLFERGLLIVKSGALQHDLPLSELQIKSPTSLTAMPQLIDQTGRALPLPLRLEEEFIRTVQAQQRKLRSGGKTVPHVKIPYATAWSEAKLWGEDRVFRIYPDGQSVLVVYAGQFLAEKLGASLGNTRIAIGPVGLLASAGVAWSDFLVGKDFDKRAALLDTMSIEELRNEAKNNDASAILNPAETSQLHLGPAVAKFWSYDYLQSQVKGRLAFKHRGWQWVLGFFSAEDRDFALQALTAAFGKEQVTNVLRG